MRENKSLPRKASHKSISMIGPEKLTRITKSKSFHVLEQEKPQTSNKKPQSHVKGFNSSLRPKKIKKHLNGSQSNQKLDKDDLKQLEDYLSRKTKLKTVISTEDKLPFNRTSKISDITPLVCIQRLKANDSKPYIVIRFSSNRKIAGLKLYRQESIVLGNTEQFEEALCDTKCDEDLDTDEEVLKVATNRVVSELLEAVRKVEKKFGCSKTETKNDKNEEIEANDETDVSKALLDDGEATN